jgi:hypothetical protein
MSQHQHPVRRIARNLAAGFRRLMSALPARGRVSGRIEYTSPTKSMFDGQVVIGIIHDPERTMRLVSVRGRVTSGNFESLATALEEIDDASTVHLDLTDAEFASAVTCARFGRMLDALEDRYVKIRTVGLQPLPLDAVD